MTSTTFAIFYSILLNNQFGAAHTQKKKKGRVYILLTRKTLVCRFYKRGGKNPEKISPFPAYSEL